MLTIKKLYEDAILALEFEDIGCQEYIKELKEDYEDEDTPDFDLEHEIEKVKEWTRGRKEIMQYNIFLFKKHLDKEEL